MQKFIFSVTWLLVSIRSADNSAKATPNQKQSE